MRDPEPILDEDHLYRRVVSFHVNQDGTLNSAAFKFKGKPDCSASVDLARLCSCARESCDRGLPEGGLAGLVAQLPRSLDLDLKHDPLPDGTNDAHSLIEGENTKSKCRLLAEGSELIIAPRRRD